MKVNFSTFETAQVVFKQQKEDDEKTPQHLCNTCTKCKDKRCDVFNRYVEPNYNRCFYHSRYNPLKVKFKPLSNEDMDKIIETEKKKLLLSA